MKADFNIVECKWLNEHSVLIVPPRKFEDETFEEWAARCLLIINIGKPVEETER